MKKIGNDNYAFYNKLENRLDSIKSKWMSTNERKKSNHIRNESRNEQNKSNYIYNESMKAGVFSVLGAIVGGLVGGPPGAIIGAAAAGGSSAGYSYYKS